MSTWIKLCKQCKEDTVEIWRGSTAFNALSFYPGFIEFNPDWNSKGKCQCLFTSILNPSQVFFLVRKQSYHQS